MKAEKIAIVGAGLVGSLLAILLANRGYQVTVFERRPDLRKADISAGKSINLALSNRGWKPLEMAGVIAEVEKMVIPMRGRMMHDHDGNLTFQPYGKQGQAINSISRGGLNQLLITEAENAGVNFVFERPIKHVDFNTTTISFENDHGDFTSDLIIGADGAFSVIRSAMQVTDRFNYSQYYTSHGYKELYIPPGANGDFQLEKNALHIWPRQDFMLIALPNLDKSFTVTLFLPFDGKNSFRQLNTNEEVDGFFLEFFPDVKHLLADLHDSWQNNPASSLVTVKCFPWVKGNTFLIGDAAHAIVPFYGQGMNCGFEDCRVLIELLDAEEDNWDKVMPGFEKQRKSDADAIADLALQNFIEMRDLVADEAFLLRKKIEARISEKYPEKWIPQYSMVTFNDAISYREALELGEKQARIMDEVMKLPDPESVDFAYVIDQLTSS
jgi:kynurenine 3-monooxygenase